MLKVDFRIFRPLLVAASICVPAASARADVVLQYEMSGQAGDQASTAATFAASGVTGVNLVRGSALTAVTGNNSINGSGWSPTNPNAYYSLGFNVAPGSRASINQLSIAGRSSNTGPGFINVLVSADGGPETQVGLLTMTGTNFNDSVLSFAGIVANSSLRVLFRAANNTSAVGGTIGSAGTFRLGDYSPDNGVTFIPITLSGSVSAVPEPAPLVLSAVACGGFAFSRWRRKN